VPIEGWVLAADRLTYEGNGQEDFSGSHVVTRIAGVYSSVQQRLECGLKPVQKVRREVIVGWVAGMRCV